MPAAGRIRFGLLVPDEDSLGTIEVGTHADLTVQSADVFDPRSVPDEALRQVRPVLAVLAGRVVFGGPAAVASRTSPGR